MGTIDFEKRLESKPYKFFDLMFRLIISNIFCAIICFTIIGIIPAFTAEVATLRDDDPKSNVFSIIKLYFVNLWHYLKKSLPIGIIFTLIYGLITYGIIWYVLNLNNSEEIINTVWEKIFVAGLVVMVFFGILFLIVCSNIPLILINFETLNIREVFRTSLYVSLKYILTSLFSCLMVAVIFGGFIGCLFDARFLAIWLLVGISLPLFFCYKVTIPIYYKLHKMNIEKLMNDYGDEEDEE